MPGVEKIATSPNKKLRDLGISFYEECYKWMGEAVLPLVEKLNKPQQDELKKQFEKMVSEGITPPKALRMTNTEESSQKEDAINEVCAKEEKEEVEKFDAFDLVDEKDCLTNYDESWAESVITAKKWSDKKSMLEAMLNDMSTTKIKPGDTSHIVTAMKKLLSDSNINVFHISIRCVGALASGLRENFSEGAKSLATQLLLKYKEKRPQIIEDITKTMTSILDSCTLVDLIECILTALGDKNPNVLKHTSAFVEMAVKQTYIDDLQDIADQILPSLISLTSHQVSEVRDSVLETLGLMKGRLGEAIVGKFISGLNPQKLTKVQEAASQVQVSKYDKSKKE